MKTDHQFEVQHCTVLTMPPLTARATTPDEDPALLPPEFQGTSPTQI